MSEETNIIKAADTIEETIAIRNNHLAKEKMFATKHTTIDVDDAKWQKEYADKMEHNLDRFKELGLYQHLQELGIVYDPKQFHKSHVAVKTSGDTQFITPRSESDVAEVYESVEKQFDEQLECDCD